MKLIFQRNNTFLMKWWWQFFMVVMGMAHQETLDNTVIYSSKKGASYNSFLRQVGYCKLQSFDTTSRNTSSSPSLFQSGRVSFGVGLSHFQFQQSIVSCGQCIQILTVDRFYQFNQELTKWNYQQPQHGNFTVMVMDECTDPICQSGFLDFDIYSDKQPVAYGNPTHLSWHFVPCPVSIEDKLEFLICLGYETCQEHHPEGRNIEELYHQAVQQNWFTIYPRNFRIALHSLHIQGEPLQDIQSWVWKSLHSEVLQDLLWLIEWTNQDGSQQSWVVDWTFHFSSNSTFGYRGGFVLATTLQN